MLLFGYLMELFNLTFSTLWGNVWLSLSAILKPNKIYHGKGLWSKEQFGYVFVVKIAFLGFLFLAKLSIDPYQLTCRPKVYCGILKPCTISLHHNRLHYGHFKTGLHWQIDQIFQRRKHAYFSCVRTAAITLSKSLFSSLFYSIGFFHPPFAILSMDFVCWTLLFAFAPRPPLPSATRSVASFFLFVPPECYNFEHPNILNPTIIFENEPNSLAWKAYLCCLDYVPLWFPRISNVFSISTYSANEYKFTTSWLMVKLHKYEVTTLPNANRSAKYKCPHQTRTRQTYRARYLRE